MKKYWTTKSGKKILISEMDLNHLKNTKAMLERVGKSALMHELGNAYSFLSTLRGEMAQYCMEGEIWRLENMTPEEWLELNEPRYEAICYWLEKKTG